MEISNITKVKRFEEKLKKEKEAGKEGGTEKHRQQSCLRQKEKEKQKNKGSEAA